MDKCFLLKKNHFLSMIILLFRKTIDELHQNGYYVSLL